MQRDEVRHVGRRRRARGRAARSPGSGSPRARRRGRRRDGEHAVGPRDASPATSSRATNGTTIEVNNTDAEGRLVLADCLAHAVEQGAERLVDVATLTGAIVVALGTTYAGLFANDDDWCEAVDAPASRTPASSLWRLPLHRSTRSDQGPLRRHRQRGRGPQGGARSRPPSSCAVHRRRALGAPRHRRHRLGHRPRLRGQGRLRLRRAAAGASWPRRAPAASEARRSEGAPGGALGPTLRQRRRRANFALPTRTV